MAYLRNIYDPGTLCHSTVYSDFATESSDFSSYSEMPSASAKSFSTKSIAAEDHKIKSTFPALPVSHNFSALGCFQRFKNYLQNVLPLAFPTPAAGASSMPATGASPVPVAAAKFRRSDVNTAYLHSLLVRSKVVNRSVGREHIDRNIFSDARLQASGLQFDAAAIMKEKKIWVGSESSGNLASPPESLKDADVRIWLNHIVNNLSIAHDLNLSPVPTKDGKTVDRNFDSSTSTKGPSGGYALLKPDIVVIDRADQHDKTQDERVHWQNVYAFIEVTGLKRDGLNHVLMQISQKAACIFDVQPQRKYVCALGIVASPPPTKKKPSIPGSIGLQFTLVIVDRAGLTHTDLTEIHGYPAMEFLRVIFAFCFASTEVIGWDPTMDVDHKSHEVRAIRVTGPDPKTAVLTTREFDVVKLIHNSPILFSRGTRVWVVKDENQSFHILKDSWISQENKVSEIDLIRHVEESLEKDPDGPLFKHACPHYIIGQETVHSTNTIRGVKFETPGTRCQRRIVTGPIGNPITSFRSKREFVTVCLDLVNGMYFKYSLNDRNAEHFFLVLEFLDKKAEVTHGDISINNAMINRVHDDEEDSPSRLRARAFAGAYKPDTVLVPLPSPSNSSVSSTSTVGEEGTTEPIDSCGMLIDCDFMRRKGHNGHQTSVSILLLIMDTSSLTSL